MHRSGQCGEAETIEDIPHRGRYVQSVLNITARGAVQEQSHRTKRRRLIFGPLRLAQLHELLHQSPRKYWQKTSTWLLLQVAQVAFPQRGIDTLTSNETIRDALRQLGVNWRRAKK